MSFIYNLYTHPGFNWANIALIQFMKIYSTSSAVCCLLLLLYFCLGRVKIYGSFLQNVLYFDVCKTESILDNNVIFKTYIGIKDEGDEFSKSTPMNTFYIVFNVQKQSQMKNEKPKFGNRSKTLKRKTRILFYFIFFILLLLFSLPKMFKQKFLTSIHYNDIPTTDNIT